MFSSPNVKYSPCKNPHSNQLALLFGWAHSEHSKLDKYAQLYNSHFSTIQFRQPTAISMEQTSHHELFRVLENLKLSKDTIIVIHIFSNGGLCYYNELLKMMENKFSFLKNMIRGVVLDSTPAKFSFSSVAIASSLHYKQAWKRQVMYLIAYVTILWLYFWKNVVRISPKIHDFGIEKMIERDIHYKIPLLFLYSEGDVISDYRFIEKMIRQLEANGANVHSVRFGTSAHVSHFVKYKERYILELGAFLSRCGFVHNLPKISKL